MGQKLKRAERNLYLDLDTGIYHVRAMIGGKPLGPYTTGHTTLKSALTKRDDIMVTLRKRADAKREVPTLEEFWKDYRGRKRKSPSTWRKDDYIMNTLVLPRYGKERLNDIGKRHMEWYLANRRRAGMAEGSVAREERLLRAIFADAIDNDLISKHPFKGIKHAKTGTRMRVLTPEEQGKVEASASPELRRYLIFLLATGIRSEEAEGLRAGDFVGHEFRVVGKGRDGEKKTRWVPILPQYEASVRAIVEEQGDPLWPSAVVVTNRLRRATKLAGVKPFGPHCLRHTFATRYMASGGNIFTLSQILGHASVSVTESVYVHLKPRDLGAQSAHVELGVKYERQA